MCAIAAIFWFNNNSERVDRAELVRMRDRMKARGPDGVGEWYSPNGKVGLAHRRLAIIDLSAAGAQPMVSGGEAHPGSEPRADQDRSLRALTFNGEIYNFRELRRDLEAKGYEFQSQTDTEVLLHLYSAYGEQMVHRLRGMYAFALWDAANGTLFLARDPFGIKPLYYYQDRQRFCAASQLKALLTLNDLDRAPDPAGHVGFFLWGHVPDPFTIYARCRSLPAGHTLTVSAEGRTELREFCNISNELAAADHSSRSLKGSELASYLHDKLLDSVSHHLIADVPTGVFLSAGLDSTTVTALAAETEVPLRTVTLGFEEFRGTPADETGLAEETARQLSARHQTIWVGRRDFSENLGRLMNAMDRPSTDGVNTFFISRAAAEAGLKVALSGVGGDELFGSYPAFREIPVAVRNLASIQRLPRFARGFRIISSPICKRFTSAKYAGLLEYGGSYGGAYLLRRGMFMPWELPDLVGPEMARAGWEQLNLVRHLNCQVSEIQSPHLKVAALEMQNYMRHQLLRDTDWASMDFSLEIRTPLVDLPLLRAVAPLFAQDQGITKVDMARAVRRSFPEAILQRPKTGFTVPVRDWLLASDPAASRARGLRGWARKIYDHFTAA